MNREKKKLLIMASLFYPQKNSGGPPVSIQNMIDEIYKDFEIYVVSKNHEIGSKKQLVGVQNGWNRCRYGKAYYFPHGQHTVVNVLKLIEEIKPNIIYQNSFFSYDDVFPVLIYKKKHPDIRVIISPRGEFQANSFENGRIKKILYIRLLKLFFLLNRVEWQVSDCSEAAYLSHVMRIPEKSVYVISNLSKGGIPVMRHKSIGSLRLLYVGRIHPHKNLKFALEILRNVIGQIQYDIYGSVEDQSYFKECCDLMSTMPASIQCTYKGVVSNTEIRQVIGQYHALFIPSKSEAFGQSIVEAMLTSVPVIISNQTPWSDLEHYSAGFALPLEDRRSFAKCLENMVGMGNYDYQIMTKNACSYIRGKLDFEQAVKQYKKMFQA